MPHIPLEKKILNKKRRKKKKKKNWRRRRRRKEEVATHRQSPSSGRTKENDQIEWFLFLEGLKAKARTTRGKQKGIIKKARVKGKVDTYTFKLVPS